MSQVIDMKTRQPMNQAIPERLKSYRKRAANIRQAIEDGQRPSAADQISVARNFHKILSELAEQDPSMRRQVVKAAGFANGADTDSTKRLDPYVLPPDYPKSRLNRLAKKATKYVDFARALEMVSNGARTEDEYLCGLFQGTSYGMGSSTNPDWSEEAWSSLANRLKSVVTAISRREGVEDYWRSVGALNGNFCVIDDKITLGRGNIDIYGMFNGTTDTITVLDEVPPIPSIIIGQTLLHPIIIGDGWIEGIGNVNLEYKVYLEVRLAMIPTSPAGGDIAPFLEFRTRTDAKHETLGWIDFEHKYWDVDVIERPARIEGKVRNVHTFIFDQYPDFEIEDYRPGCEHHYWAFKEVNAKTLEAVFQQKGNQLSGAPGCFEMEACKMFYPGKFETDKDFNEGEFLSRFRANTAAHFLDMHLSSGLLEHELTLTLRSRKTLIEDYRCKLLDQIETNEAKALARWNGARSTSDNSNTGPSTGKETL